MLGGWVVRKEINQDFKMMRHLEKIILGLFLVFLFASPGRTAEPSGVVRVITVAAAITPISAEFILDNLAAAEKENAACLVIELDTPGGLDEAMRDIVKAILGSKMPVVVYVYPSGARSASAGAVITLAAHVAAMAPGTNIGAAHPVAIGEKGMDEAMMKKVENDAAAYVRGLAAKRGRNQDWAENAVRKSISTQSEEALKQKVIDLISPSLTDLLTRIDGRKVEVSTGEVVLKTKEARVERVQMGMRHRILTTIVNPNLAYILMIIGMWGIFFELSNPGSIVPGVIGGISLLLAFVAFQTLPINYAGLLLIVLALVLFIAEVKITSYGLLTVGGIISMILGSIMLFESPAEGLHASWKVIIPSVLATAAFFVAALTLALRAQLRKPTTGQEGMIGMEGTASSRLDPKGKVFVNGELWDAESSEPVEDGRPVRVEEVKGMVLRVSKVSR